MLIARLQPKQANHTKTKKMEDAQNKTKQNKTKQTCKTEYQLPSPGKKNEMQPNVTKYKLQPSANNRDAVWKGGKHSKAYSTYGRLMHAYHTTSRRSATKKQ